MDWLYLSVLFIHIFAAVVWVGGTFFLALVGPSVRRDGSGPAREFLREAGFRFRDASWVAVGLLVLTGVVILSRRGQLDDLPAAVARSPALGWKIGVVLAMIGVKAAHDFYVGPRASAAANATTGSPTALPVWRLAMFLGKANLILGAAVLFLGVLVSRGG